MRLRKKTCTGLVLTLIVVSVTTIGSSQVANQTAKKQAERYQCTPCGHDCDKKIYSGPGQCSECKMQLVKSNTITFKSIEPTEICNYIKQHPKAVLLDVRTKEEFDGKASPNFGTLKNAINIPVQELEAKIKSINGMKNREVLVYCSHSHRSPQASYMLTQNGFTNVTNMAGGMSVVHDPSCKK